MGAIRGRDSDTADGRFWIALGERKDVRHRTQ